MKYQEYKELSDAMEQAAHKFYQLRYQFLLRSFKKRELQEV